MNCILKARAANLRVPNCPVSYVERVVEL